MNFEWLDHIEAGVTVCDREGIILYMNAHSAESFKDQGGINLVGKNLFECHLETSGNRIRKMLEDGETNVYTIEKNGKKKFIWQAPWLEDDVCKGLIEIHMPIPAEIPHFNRDIPKG
jgi:transcriptional regulator with PAS, ATPase and Fis domain